jgi:hypothetical protein
MSEILFKFAESAVSLSNVVLSLLVSLLISAAIWVWIGSVGSSIRNGIIASVSFQLALIIIFFVVRGKVQKERLDIIFRTMSTIEASSSGCEAKAVNISNWREGLKCIKRCPTEAGYYIKTADLLEADRDYESAATLIEMGLDIIRQEPPSPPLCERLKRYYRHLPNRTTLDEKCGKFHEL